MRTKSSAPVIWWTAQSGAEARAYLAQIGWTQRGLAAHIGVDETRVRRMLTGVLPMDEGVLKWLKLLADFHAAHPAPQLAPLRRFDP